MELRGLAAQSYPSVCLPALSCHWTFLSSGCGAFPDLERRRKAENERSWTHTVPTPRSHRAHPRCARKRTARLMHLFGAYGWVNENTHRFASASHKGNFSPNQWIFSILPEKLEPYRIHMLWQQYRSRKTVRRYPFSQCFPTIICVGSRLVNFPEVIAKWVLRIKKNSSANRALCDVTKGTQG